jgi:hypothetical protein
MHTKFRLEILEGRDHSEDLGINGRIILKLILGKQVWRVWIGFIWPKVGTGGRLFNSSKEMGTHVHGGLLGCDAVWTCLWIPNILEEHTAFIFRLKCGYPLLSPHSITTQKATMDRQT